jgi:hypothetical protein
MQMRARRLLMALVCMLMALPAMADTRFRVRQMVRNDVPVGKGQCDIRLYVDGEVEVSVRGEMVLIRTISGRDARDDGSECNAPLPPRAPGGFGFEVKDKRGDIRLLAEPSRRSDFAAVVGIRDGQGGEGRYHFRLSWALGGGGGGDRMDDRRGPDRQGPDRMDDRRGPDRMDDRQGPDRMDDRRGPDRMDDRRGPDRMDDRRGGLNGWNRTVDFSGRGDGRYSREGSGFRRITETSVRIDRDGNVSAGLVTEGWGRIELSGRVTRVMGDDRIAADVRAEDPRGPRGEMVFVLGRDRVREISLSGTAGRDRCEISWRNY